MLRSFRILLPFIIVASCVAFFSCEKEKSYENGQLPGGGGTGGGGSSSGTAVYSFAGAPASCVSPIINGSYDPGTALSSLNTVVLTINVSTVGTYNVSTATNNGVAFSGSGTFTFTGPQVLVLTGAGTPSVAGTFNYTPGSNGCSFNIIF